MSGTVEYIKNPVYVSEDKLHIDCIVKFSNINSELPFTASKNDVEPHGVAIYKTIVSGAAGNIKPYVAPPPVANTTPTPGKGPTVL